MKAFGDLKRGVKTTQVFDPDTVTSDQNCTGVDMKGYEDVMFLVSVGASGDTLSGSVYTLLEVEESDNNSTYTDCADADIDVAVTGTNTGTFAKIDDAAEDDTVYKVRYLGNKRYARVVINVVGTHTNGTPIAVLAQRSGSNYLPES